MPIILDGDLGITTPALTVTGATVNTGGISTAGNLTFTSTGQRITGDFSNATIANRVLFQTSTTNASTGLNIFPNGTAVVSGFAVSNSSDTVNYGYGQLAIGSTLVSLEANKIGTGTYLPLSFSTGGSERMRIDTSGNVGIGTSSPASYNGLLNVKGSDRAVIGYFGGTTYAARLGANASTATIEGVDATTGVSSYQPLQVGGSVVTLATGGSERMRIDSSGNVGIGTSSPTAGYKLDVNGNIRVAGSGPTELGYGLYATARLNASGNNAIFGFVLDGSQGGAYNGRDWRIEQGRNAVGNFNITEIAGGNPIRLSINGSGNVALSESNASANGIGITFPAAQSASSDANCLDDYEEGTWTPVWSGSTSGSGSAGASGSYIKIGRQVTITVVMNNAIPFITFVGTLFCSLPFPCSGITGGDQFIGAPMYYYTGGSWNTGSVTAGITPTCFSGNNYMGFTYMLTNGDRQTQVTNGTCSLSGSINTYARFSLTYFTDN